VLVNFKTEFLVGLRNQRFALLIQPGEQKTTSFLC
jgi:hypothetical protein